MAAGNTSAGSSSGKIQRIIVLVFGVIMCLLLFFADKTNLTNRSESVVGSNSVSVTNESTGVTNSIPPLASDPKVDQWIKNLENVSGSEKLTLLDSIILNLETRKRFVYASQYASDALAENPSEERKKQVGRLSYLATQMDFVQQDSALFQRLSEQSIQALEDVVKVNAQDEEALLYLGLAYTRSRKVENSMNGIMTLRKLLEINPDNIEGSYQMGLFSMQTGQFERAIARFEKVLSLDPNNYPAQLQLALAYAESDQPEKAKPLLESLVKSKATPDEKRTARELLNNL
ncbi:MAG: tetratricopeptide repeat protein [Bacteroidetes bacterium]|nr:tetratricopeptide repeat protein [Bacteroidota bacterium]MCB0841946.1 tetratricopeptide repeat protein [Bacteroidota bacterium]